MSDITWKFWLAVRDRLSALKWLEGSRTVRIGMLAAVSLLSTLALAPSYLSAPFNRFQVGDIANATIRVPRTMEAVDEKATRVKIEEAERSVRPIYDYDQTILSQSLVKVREAYAYMRSLVQGKQLGRKARRELWSQHRERFQKIIGATVDDETFRVLQLNSFSEQLENATVDLLRTVFPKRIVGSTEHLRVEHSQIAVRPIGGKAPGDIKIIDVENIVDLSGVRKLMEEWGRELLKERLVYSRSAIVTLVKNLLRPNLTFNREETESKKREAVESVKDVTIPLKKGEVIVREGDPIEPRHVVILEGIQKSQKQFNYPLIFLGFALFIVLNLLVLYNFGFRYLKSFHLRFKDAFFVGLIAVAVMWMVRLGSWLAIQLGERGLGVSPSIYYYAIPICAGAMTIRYVLSSEIALLFTIFVSLVCGIIVDNSLYLAAFYMISGLIAIGEVAHAKSRLGLLQAGSVVGLINALTILLLSMIEGDLHWKLLAARMGFGFFGGLAAATLVIGISPFIESAFGYLTDTKLLELSNLNQVLLKELMVQAPGTFQHSYNMGILVDAAAQAIDAHTLLSRVSCYYHDIGKLKKPRYFIENQFGNENLHDKLTPSMSALIIIAHVKDGVEMARDHNLPSPIVDIIQQHHGTTLVRYFYNKAKEMEDPNVDEVDEKDYRYPGPKPQTREAAIVMLADATEASSRTVMEPTSARLQGLVQKIINRYFSEGQLSECDLTLHDLHLIAKSFTKVLTSIYHQRIEYPDRAYKSARERDGAERVADQKERIKDVKDLRQEGTEKPGNKASGSEDDGEEDLKRLGM